MTSAASGGNGGRAKGAGHKVLKGSRSILAPSGEIRSLYRLSDPALSELDLEDLLDELLRRVREALDVDTVAILLLDAASNELVARAARGIEEEVEQGVRIPIGRGFAGRIAAERTPIMIPDVHHADILNPILREKGIRSLLGVPLIVEGGLIGVMHVGSLTPREFKERDAAVLELAAARAAPAIERARLRSELEREHRLAILLQQSLLPKQLPNVVGVSVAARYVAAGDEVGGDWYDVVELPRGQVGIAIGDVVGHGIGAAALMGQLRTALHCFALEGHRPGRVLELVDRFMQGMGELTMATAAYGVFDPEAQTLQFATAGHPPPVIVAGDRSRVVDVAPAVPLGVFPYGSYPEHEVELASGETVVLYTDGLIEHQPVSPSAAIDQLVDRIRDFPSAEEACRMALGGANRPEELRDDIAIVALHSEPIPDKLELRLPADPEVLASIRQVLRRWLRSHGATEDEVGEITIAVNEACANAVEHAYAPGPAEFELQATAADHVLSFVVRDAGNWRPKRGQERGRGLGIMDAAMDEVDVAREPGGTTVNMRRRIG